jgi:Ca2+/Na+ antiporter
VIPGLLLAALFAGCLALWVGVPLLWLWLGSLVQSATDDVGAAIGAMILGVTVTIGIMLAVLSRITRAYQDARVARGLDDTGGFPLEVAMTVSAMLAVAFIVVWFIFGGGAQPLVFGE